MDIQNRKVNMIISVVLGLMISVTPILTMYSNIVSGKLPEQPETFVTLYVDAGTTKNFTELNPSDGDLITINATGTLILDYWWSYYIGDNGTIGLGAINNYGNLIHESGTILHINGGSSFTCNEGSTFKTMGTFDMPCYIYNEDNTTTANNMRLGGINYLQNTIFYDMYYIENHRGFISLTNCTIFDVQIPLGFTATIGGGETIVKNCTIYSNTTNAPVLNILNTGTMTLIDCTLVSITDNYLLSGSSIVSVNFINCTYQGNVIEIDDFYITTTDYAIRMYDYNIISTGVANASVSVNHPSMIDGYMYDDLMLIQGFQSYSQTDSNGDVKIPTLNRSATWYSGLAIEDREWKNWSNGGDSESGDNQKWNFTISKIGYETNYTTAWSGTNAICNLTAIEEPEYIPPGLEGNNYITTFSDVVLIDNRANFTYGENIYLNGTLQFNSNLTNAYVNTTVNQNGIPIIWLSNDTYSFINSTTTNFYEIYNSVLTFDTSILTNGTYTINTTIQHENITNTEISCQFSILPELISIPEEIQIIHSEMRTLNPTTKLIDSTLARNEELQVNGTVITSYNTTNTPLNISVYNQNLLWQETLLDTTYSFIANETVYIDSISGVLVFNSTGYTTGQYIIVLNHGNTNSSAQFSILPSYLIGNLTLTDTFSDEIRCGMTEIDELQINGTIFASQTEYNSPINISVYDSGNIWQETLLDTTYNFGSMTINSIWIINSNSELIFNSTGYLPGDYQIVMIYGDYETHIQFTIFGTNTDSGLIKDTMIVTYDNSMVYRSNFYTDEPIYFYGEFRFNANITNIWINTTIYDSLWNPVLWISNDTYNVTENVAFYYSDVYGSNPSVGGNILNTGTHYIITKFEHSSFDYIDVYSQFYVTEYMIYYENTNTYNDYPNTELQTCFVNNETVYFGGEILAGFSLHGISGFTTNATIYNSTGYKIEEIANLSSSILFTDSYVTIDDVFSGLSWNTSNYPSELYEMIMIIGDYGGVLVFNVEFSIVNNCIIDNSLYLYDQSSSSLQNLMGLSDEIEIKGYVTSVNNFYDVPINISIYDSNDVWQETLLNTTYSFTENVQTSISTINSGDLIFNSTGYSEGEYYVLIIINGLTIYAQFSIVSIMNIEMQITEPYTNNIRTTLSTYDQVEINATINPIATQYDTPINVSVTNYSSGWVETLFNGTYNFTKNVQTDLFTIAETNVIFNSTGYLPGNYTVKLNYNSWYVAIQIEILETFVDSAFIRTLNYFTYEYTSIVMSGSALWVEGIINTTQICINTQVSIMILYQNMSYRETLLNTTHTFVQSGVTIADINGGDLLFNTYNFGLGYAPIGDYYVQLSLSKTDEFYYQTYIQFSIYPSANVSYVLESWLVLSDYTMDIRSDYSFDDTVYISGTVEFSSTIYDLGVNISIYDQSNNWIETIFTNETLGLIVVGGVQYTLYDFNSGYITFNLTNYSIGQYYVGMILYHAIMTNFTTIAQFSVMQPYSYWSGAYLDDYLLEPGNTTEFEAFVIFSYNVSNVNLTVDVFDSNWTLVENLYNSYHNFTANNFTLFTDLIGSSLILNTTNYTNGLYYISIYYEKDGFLISDYVVPFTVLTIFRHPFIFAVTTNDLGIPLSSITTYATIYYNATIISTETNATVNISVYNSVGTWQETLYNGSVNFISGIPLNTTEINGIILSFNSTGYATGSYQIQLQYITTETYTVYSYFTIREPIIIQSILTTYTGSVISAIQIGNTASILATFTPYDNIYNANVNISVWRDVGGIKVFSSTLLSTTHSFSYGITVTSTDIAGAITWSTTGKSLGLYYIRTQISKTGEMTIQRQEWGLTIQAPPVIQMANNRANVRAYNDTGTSVIASQYILNETVYFNGNVYLNQSLNNVGVILTLYTEEGWSIILLDTTYNFVGGLDYSLFTINGGSLITWESNTTGQCFVVLELEYSGTPTAYITEDFVVEIEHVCPETELPIENELLLLAYMIILPILIILIIFMIVDKMKSAIHN